MKRENRESVGQVEEIRECKETRREKECVRTHKRNELILSSLDF